MDFLHMLLEAVPAFLGVAKASAGALLLSAFCTDRTMESSPLLADHASKLGHSLLLCSMGVLYSVVLFTGVKWRPTPAVLMASGSDSE